MKIEKKYNDCQKVLTRGAARMQGVFAIFVCSMDSLIIKPTEKFLGVTLDAKTGKLSFEGRSLPEDGKEFFMPIISWLQQYAQKPQSRTECCFKMEYFNSSSRKCFVDVFDVLDSIREKGSEVVVVWQYEEGDDELKEMGEEYESLYDLPFEFRSY